MARCVSGPGLIPFGTPVSKPLLLRLFCLFLLTVSVAVAQTPAPFLTYDFNDGGFSGWENENTPRAECNFNPNYCSGGASWRVTVPDGILRDYAMFGAGYGIDLRGGFLRYGDYKTQRLRSFLEPRRVGPLGITLNAHQLTLTGSGTQTGSAPANARLDARDSAWRGTNAASWVQVDFFEDLTVSAIQIQGSPAADEWVTSFEVLYATNASPSTFVSRGTFTGNTDRNTTVTAAFAAINARYIRLRPIAWRSVPAIRFEVYGTSVERALGITMRGPGVTHLQNGLLTGVSGTPANGRLRYTTGWVATSATAYLQVNLEALFTITGVAVQSHVNDARWMKTFHLEYSADGASWTYLKSGAANVVFNGPTATNQVAYNDVTPTFVAQYVRLRPATLQGTVPTARWELYGDIYQPETDIGGSFSWSDYEFTSQVQAWDHGAFGWAFRYQDIDNHYEFKIDQGQEANLPHRLSLGYLWAGTGDGTGLTACRATNHNHARACPFDKNLNTFWESNSVDRPRWYVELSGYYMITKVRVHLGRVAAKNLEIATRIWNSDDNNKRFCGPTGGVASVAAGAIYEVECNWYGRYVDVAIAWGTQVLAIREVEVFTTPQRTHASLIKRSGGIFTELATYTGAPLREKVWHNLKISAVGNRITVHKDTTQLIAHTDATNPLLSGTIAPLSAVSYGSFFDNVVLTFTATATTVGATLNSQSVKQGFWKHYYLTTDSTQRDALQIKTFASVGTGLQIYVRKGTNPDATTYDYRNIASTDAYTTVIFPLPERSTAYYISVFANHLNSPTVTFSLASKYITATAVAPSTTVLSHSAPVREWYLYKATVPVNYQSMTATVTVTTSTSVASPLETFARENVPPTLDFYDETYAVNGSTKSYPLFIGFPVPTMTYYMGIFASHTSQSTWAWTFRLMPASPSIETITPSSMVTSGGRTLTISGSATFGTGGTVTVGGTNCPVTLYQYNNIECTAPQGQGTVFVQVTTNLQQTSNSLPFLYLPPVINSANPANGPTIGGTQIVLSGANFGVTPTVLMGTTTCTIASRTHTSVTFVLPPGTGRGLPITLTVGGQASSPVEFNYLAPVITSVTPLNGPTGGTSRITINGSNFGASPSTGTVVIGSSACGSVTWTHTQVVCNVPAGHGASLPIRVTVDGQQTTAMSSFSYLRPSISSVDPTIGSTDGTTVMTLNGANFGLAPTVAVGPSVASLVSFSHTSIVFRLPQGDGANRPVQVTALAQVSNVVYVNSYGPIITLVEPLNIATSGQPITLTGTNFGLSGVVTVSENDCVPTSWSHTRVVCTAPPGRGSTNPVVIVVNGLSSGILAGMSVKYAVPAIDNITPSSVTTAGGTILMLTGSNFGTIGSILVGSSNCPIYASSYSHTQIRCTLPQGQGLNVDVVVTAGDQSSPPSKINYMAPSITAVSPSSSSTQGGDLVTLTGTNFGRTGSVFVGGQPCSWTADEYSHTQVVCTTTASTAVNTERINVTVSGQVSNLWPYGFTNPSITRVSPATSTTAPGTLITITGSSFDRSGTVTIAGSTCTLQSWSHLSVVCAVPAGQGLNVPLVLTTVASKVASTTFSYQAPVLSSITPSSGSTAGGEIITLTGSSFGLSGTVQVGANQCLVNGALTGTVWGHTSIRCALPAGSGRSNAIRVTVAGQTSGSLMFNYLPPVVSLLDPANGPTKCNFPVIIHGSNFFSSGAVVVVGDTQATIESQTHTTISCIFPSLGNGPKPVVVTVDGQASFQANFYYDAPSIISLDPSNGPTGGDIPVTLRGASFGTNPNVYINNVLQSLVGAPTQEMLVVTLPPGEGAAQQFLVTTGVDALASNIFLFNYDAPAVDSISPNNAAASGNIPLTITGSNFGLSTPTVRIGTLLCPVVSTTTNVLPHEVVCTVPRGTGLNLAVTLTVAEQTSVANDAARFSYLPPQLSTVSPAVGPTAGGIIITLSGSSFGVTGYVFVGGVACPVVNLQYSDSHIECQLPGGSGLINDVEVQRDDQQRSMTLNFEYLPPSIASISPANGPTAGNFSVIVIGDNLGVASSRNVLTLGTGLCTPTGSGWSHTRVECLAPEGMGRNITLQADVTGQLSNVNTIFSYDRVSVSSVSPSHGPTEGGVTITVFGDNFGTGTPEVFIGVDSARKACLDVDRLNHTALTCTLPALQGNVETVLTVRVSDVDSNEIPFTYDSPVIFSVAGCVDVGNTTVDCPVMGGIPIIINGMNFGDASQQVVAHVQDLECKNAIQTIPHTQITCMLPSGVNYERRVRIIIGGMTEEKYLLSYAGPEIYAETIVPASFDSRVVVSPNNDVNNISFTTTDIGGVRVEFDGRNFGNFMTNISVYYGPDSDPTMYSCADPQGNDGHLSCVLSSGTGFNMHFQVHVQLDIGWETIATAISRLSADFVSFPQPKIKFRTLGLAANSSMSRTDALQGTETEGERVIFECDHIGTQAGNLKVFYGPEGVEPKPYECTGVKIEQADKELSCRTEAGEGGPYVFQVLATNQYSVEGTDTYNYPEPPQLHSISGCRDVGNSTVDCPTEGGVVLTIRGDKFSPAKMAIKIDVADCTRLTFISVREVRCTLARGVGLNRSVSLRVGTGYARPQNLVSYAYATLYAISGCEISPSNLNTTVNCPRAGGQYVTITGVNFGPGVPIVLIGDSRCEPVDQDATVPHRKITCKLDSGTELDRTVVFVQKDGEIAPNRLSLSYRPCAFGYYAASGVVECSPCRAGTYTDSLGQETCKACESGFFNPSTGQSFCSRCSAGSVSVRTLIDVGPTACVDCVAGYYAATSGQSSCSSCASGTYSNQTRRATCTLCPLGEYASAAASVKCSKCVAGTFYDSTGGFACKDCPAGRFSGLNASSSCSECDAGRFNSLSAKTICSDCPLGHAIGTLGQPICQACPSGFFANDTGMLDCMACPAGYYSGPGASSCLACAAGSYINVPGQATCLFCPRGSYQNLTGESACERCVSGTVSRNIGQSFCSDCARGYYAENPGSSDCLPCAVGSYTANTATITCTACPAGTAQSRTGSTVCSDCAIGFAIATTGEAVCKACAAGTVTNSTRQSQCFACPVGYYSNLQSTECIACDAGSITEAQGQAGCSNCPAGFYQSETAGTVCFACEVGTAVSTIKSATCDDCEPGYFSPTTGAVECQACEVGHYAPTNGSSECLPCEPGSSQALAGQDTCPLCARGKYTSDSRQAACVDCPAGRYNSERGSTSCIACAPGTYGNQVSMSVCLNCTTGTYIGSEGQLVCINCPIGRFASSPASVSCQACDRGYIAATERSSVCTPCPTGHIADNEGLSYCTACPAGAVANDTALSQCSLCETGKYVSTGGKSACSDCDPGTVFNGQGGVVCNRCPAGRHAQDPGMSECVSCQPGSFTETDSQANCTKCAAGYFTDSYGQVQCDPCEIGMYAETPGADVCMGCPPGRAQASSGSSHCDICDPGYANNVGASASCTPCQAGFYANESESLTCTPCPAGQITDAAGQAQCTDCPAGYANPAEGQSECFICPAGAYSDAKGSHTCTSCAPGNFSSTSGTSTCAQCPIGQFAASFSAIVCDSCPVGQYNDLVEQASCKQCPRGSYNADVAQSSCTVCAVGTFSASEGLGLCLPCPSGSYQNSTNSTACISCTAGTAQINTRQTFCSQCERGYAQSASSQPVCVACEPGSFADSLGTVTCALCSEGHWSGKAVSACQQCEVGKSNENLGQAACALCPSGTAMDELGAFNCTPCEPGYSQELAGEPICNPCLPGRFAEGTGSLVCLDCPAGTYTDQSGRTNCSDCEAGKYQDQSGSLSCTPCRPGDYEDSLGSKVCKKAPLGRFVNESGQTDYLPCPTGRYQNQYGRSICFDCPVGRFTANTGQSECNLCPKGHYMNVSGSTACLPCEPGSSQSTEGNALCTDCPPGTARDSPGQETCLECAPGSFSNTNRSSNCTLCPAGQFEPGYRSNFSCTDCGLGEYAPTRGYQRCDKCPSGRFFNATGAVECTQCAPGKSQALQGMSTCVDCAAGFFTGAWGQAECTRCPVGQFMNTSGASVCHACPSGSHQDKIGSTECKGCPEGEQQPQNGQEFCELCPVGSFSNTTGLIRCFPCARGQFQSAQGSRACRPCEPGTFAQFTGTPVCTRCEPGTFMGGYNATVCDNCVPGTYQHIHGQRNCTECPVGKYTDIPAQPICAECSPGRFTNTTNNVGCLGCVAGDHQDRAGQTACDDCEAGTFTAVGSQPVCAVCPGGQYQPDDGKTTCKLCPIGKARSGDNATQCDDCAPGRFSNQEGQVFCQQAPEGYYIDTTGATAPSSCGRGEYQNNPGSVDCILCPSGRFNVEIGQPQCAPCNNGTFINVTGSTLCTDCFEGKYQPEFGATACFDCDPGSYIHARGQSECYSCPLGLYNNGSGLTRCFDCAAGTYQPDEKATVCHECASGTISSSPRSVSCDRCYNGTFATGLANTICSLCTGGTYQYFPGQAYCDDCSTGTFSDAGAAECTPCPANTISPVMGMSKNCFSCNPFSFPNEDRSECLCDVSYAGKFVNTTGNNGLNYTMTLCFSCPTGAVCEIRGQAWDEMAALKGWWKTSDRFYRCLMKAHCEGGASGTDEQCGPNRIGVLCNYCKPGYTTGLLGGCQECPETGGSVVYFLLVVLAVVVVMVIQMIIVLRSGHELRQVSKQDKINKRRKNMGYIIDELDDFSAEAVRRHQGMLTVFGPPPPKPGFVYKLKIALSFAQIVTSVTGGLEVQFPENFKTVVTWLNPANMDIMQMSSVGCVTTTDYYDKLLLMTLLPICVAGLPLLYLLAKYSRATADPHARASARKKFWKLFLFGVFLVYPMVSSTILRLFVCKTVEGHHYLLADFSVECYDSRWNDYSFYAIFMILVYPVGIPVMFFLVLYTKRHKLSTAGTRSELGFLYDAYHHKDRWWFEMCDMLHKLSLTSMIAFFPFDMQMPAAMAFSFCYTCSILILQPYLRKGDDRLALLSQTEVLLLLMCGHVFNNEIEFDPLMDLVLTVVLIGGIILFFGMFLVQGLLFLYKFIIQCFWPHRVKNAPKKKSEQLDEYSRPIDDQKRLNADEDVELFRNPAWNPEAMDAFIDADGVGLDVNLNPLVHEHKAKQLDEAERIYREEVEKVAREMRRIDTDDLRAYDDIEMASPSDVELAELANEGEAPVAPSAPPEHDSDDDTSDDDDDDDDSGPGAAAAASAPAPAPQPDEDEAVPVPVPVPGEPIASSESSSEVPSEAEVKDGSTPGPADAVASPDASEEAASSSAAPSAAASQTKFSNTNFKAKARARRKDSM